MPAGKNFGGGIRACDSLLVFRLITSAAALIGPLIPLVLQKQSNSATPLHWLPHWNPLLTQQSDASYSSWRSRRMLFLDTNILQSSSFFFCLRIFLFVFIFVPTLILAWCWFQCDVNLNGFTGNEAKQQEASCICRLERQLRCICEEAAAETSGLTNHHHLWHHRSHWQVAGVTSLLTGLNTALDDEDEDAPNAWI